MKVLKCAGCGAPFDEVPEDAIVECQFCGAVNQPTILRRPQAPDVQAVQIFVGTGDAPEVVRTVAKTGAAAAIVGLVITLMAVGITVAGV